MQCGELPKVLSAGALALGEMTAFSSGPLVDSKMRNRGFGSKRLAGKWESPLKCWLLRGHAADASVLNGARAELASNFKPHHCVLMEAIVKANSHSPD